MFIKIWSREYTVQYCECALRATGLDVKNHLPLVLRSFMISEYSNQSYYASAQEWNEYNKKLAAVFDSKPLLNRQVNNFYKYGQKYVTKSKRIGSLKLFQFSNQALAKKYLDYIKILNIYTAYLWTGYSLNELAAEKGRQLLETKKINKEQLDLILRALFAPIKRTSILRLQDFLEKQKRQLHRLPKDLLAKILGDYAWISCLDLQNDPWTKKELLDFFKHLKISKENAITFKQAVKLAKLNSEGIHMFKLIRQLSYIKDLRDEYRRKGVFNILPLFDEIGRRLNLSRKEVSFLTNREIVAGLIKGLVKAKEIKLRNKGYVFFWRGNDLVISTNKKDLEFYRKKLSSNQASKQVSGFAASSGKAKGRVRIVVNVSDLRKVSKGDILVAVTTHPDFVPAMQKAGAIVTDEGGLTSHAAIVSREMKKPCIVGTKVATKILKDGDMVEVDANKGIVRKIK